MQIADGQDGDYYLNLADECEGEAKRSYKSVCECYNHAYAAMGATAFWMEIDRRGKKRFAVKAFLKNGDWVDPVPPPARSPVGPMKAAIRRFFFQMTDEEKEQVVSFMLGEKT